MSTMLDVAGAESRRHRTVLDGIITKLGTHVRILDHMEFYLGQDAFRPTYVHLRSTRA